MNSANPRLSAVRERIRTAVDEGVWPAVQIAVARNGELLAAESFGASNGSDRFCLFSATKPIVASVVWQLISEGLLGLGTRVAEVWPEFGAHGKDVVTIEQVLSHTCGFPSGAIDRQVLADADKRAETMEQWCLDWEPGTRYAYHETSAHWVLAELIRRITGQDHRAALRTRILEPLGLKRLELGVPAERQADLRPVAPTGRRSMEVLEALFGVRPDEAVLDAGAALTSAVANDPELIAVGIPGAGAFSDAADVALFYQALLHNKQDLWRPDVLAAATGNISNTFPDPLRAGASANRTIGMIVAGPEDGAALTIEKLGLTVPLRSFTGASERAFGHGGAGGQTAWADPATGLSFCLLTSGMDRDLIGDLERHVAIDSAIAALA